MWKLTRTLRVASSASTRLCAPRTFCQVRLRLGTLKGYAGLGLLSYRRVFEDQGIFGKTAARLRESCGDQQ